MKLALALRLIAAASCEAEKTGCNPIAVAVIDAGGHLVALHRQDGAANLRPAIAIGKATGALGMGMPSHRLGTMAQERSWFVGSLATLNPAGLVPAAGGQVVVAHECIIGAIGISGDTSEKDDACALRACEACGVDVLP